MLVKFDMLVWDPGYKASIFSIGAECYWVLVGNKYMKKEWGRRLGRDKKTTVSMTLH